MNRDKYVFAQIAEFLDHNKFRRLVDKFAGDSYVKHFTCWNQLLTLMFGQLSGRDSLRDLVTVLEAHRSKCYHLGLGSSPVSRNAFAVANPKMSLRLLPPEAPDCVSQSELVQEDDGSYRLELHIRPDAFRRFVLVQRQIAIDWQEEVFPPLEIKVRFTVTEGKGQ